MRPAGALLFSLAALAVAIPAGHAGDDGLTGNWKLTLVPDGRPVTLWLVKLASKGGKLTGAIEALGRTRSSTVKDLRLEGDRLYFTVGLKDDKEAAWTFEGLLPKVGSKKILGSMPWNEPDMVGGFGNEGDTLVPAVLELTQAKDGFEVEKELVARFPNDPRVFGAVQELLAKAAGQKIPLAEVQEWTQTGLKAAGKYGPRLVHEMALRFTDQLLDQEGYGKAALAAAREAEKNLPAKTPLEQQLLVLHLLAVALRQAGEAEALGKIEARIDKIEAPMREEFHKILARFKTDKFPGRKGKSTRAVLVEQFTGAQYPPSVAPALAGQVLTRTFSSSEVILLNYHYHFGGPDALTNADSVIRLEYYKKNQRVHPVYINGQIAPMDAKEVEEFHKKWREKIDPLLETPALVKVQVQATRKADKIKIQVSVSGVEKPENKLRLRVVLVEEEVRYFGRQQLPFHHHVVRALPGGPQGLPLAKKDVTQTLDVDLAQVQAGLLRYFRDYLADFNKERKTPYRDDQRPVDLRHLRVVAFVQHDETHDVLQAVQTKIQQE